MQSASGLVERVAGAAASAAFVQGIGGQVDDVEGVHHSCDVRDLLDRRGLAPGEAIHRDHLDPFAPRLVAGVELGLEGFLGAAFDHVQQPCTAGSIPPGGEVDDDRNVLVPARVTPHMLIHAKDLHAVETGVTAGQAPASFVEDGGVGGVPRDPSASAMRLIDKCATTRASNAQAQGGSGELASRRRRAGEVLAPHVPAADAAVAP